MQGPLYYRPDAGPILTPVDPLEAAGPFVGVPWRPRGATPSGWHCGGCVAYLRRLIWGLESPGLEGLGVTPAEVRSVDRVEELVLAGVQAWRPVECRPGAVILFEVRKRLAHVGLVLSATDFVHSFGGEETTILPIDRRPWSARIRGFYDTADEPSVYRP